MPLKGLIHVVFINSQLTKQSDFPVFLQNTLKQGLIAG